VVTLALIAVLFGRFDWRKFALLLLGTPLWFYLASFTVVLVGLGLYTLRWRLVLRAIGVEVSFGRLFRQYLISLFFGNFLPTTVGGDVAKVYYLGRDEGYVDVGASVVLDRFLGLLSLTVIATILAWSLDVTTMPFVVARQTVTVLALGCVAVWLGVGLVSARARMTPAPAGGAAAPPAAPRWRRLADHCGAYLLPVRAVAQRPWILGAVAAIVLTYFLLLTAAYRVFFWLTGAADVGTLPVLTAVIMISVFSSVPITVNGIGLREQLHFLLLAELGLPKEVSVGISLLMFAHVLLMSLAGYAVWVSTKMGGSRLAAPTALRSVE
jgi:uncharacterized protein (TIRG00374 family)